MEACFYILASQKNGTLYVGLSTTLIKRVYQHKTKAATGFTSEYNVDQLVYYEIFDCLLEAKAREKQLKKWNRAWKIELIEQHNPNWDDLYDTLWGEGDNTIVDTSIAPQ
jgi:putative endonuclease